MPQLKILGIVVASLALIWAIVVFSSRKLAPVIDTGTTQNVGEAEDTENTKNATSAINVASPTAPSLKRQVKYSTSLSPEAKNILGERIAKLRETLSKNKNDFSAWMNLALQYKGAGDYEGAREIWEYVSSMRPAEGIALHNLGDLYHHFLNDFPKAEQYYLRSIDVNRAVGINYLALYELYRYSYKQETAAAADILQKGIVNVSGNQVIDLYSMLGSYYQEKNDAVNAIVYFTYARDGAQKLGNTMLVAQFNDELSALKK